MPSRPAAIDRSAHLVGVLIRQFDRRVRDLELICHHLPNRSLQLTNDLLTGETARRQLHSGIETATVTGTGYRAQPV
jgi:hypothetical protein